MKCLATLQSNWNRALNYPGPGGVSISGTVVGMDADAERTRMYSQRVPEIDTPSGLAHNSGPQNDRIEE